jgi:hypothetical protein
MCNNIQVNTSQTKLPPKDFISILEQHYFLFGISFFTLEQVYFPWNDFRAYGTTLFSQ